LASRSLKTLRLSALLGLLPISTQPTYAQTSEKIEKIRPERDPVVITIRSGADYKE
jgi:hypothetical protein